MSEVDNTGEGSVAAWTVEPLDKLFDAVRQGDPAGVRDVLPHVAIDGALPALLVNNGMLMHELFRETPTDVGSNKRILDVTQQLIEAGVSVNGVNDAGETPLVCAARSAIQLMLNVNDAADDVTRLSVVTELLQAKADVDVGDPEGETPLMEAAVFGDTSLCRTLLVARADPTQRCTTGESAQEFGESSPEVLSLFTAFLQNGAAAATAAAAAPPPAGAADTPSQARRLSSALMEANGGALADAELKEVEQAAGIGASHRQLGELLNVHDTDGTLLLALAQTPSPAGMTIKAVSWLLAARASPNVRNARQETPLMLAVRTVANGHWEQGCETVRALLDAAAHPNACDAQGDTPLMEAACVGDTRLCKVLLAAKADVAQKSLAGMTPAQFAEDHPEVLELLKEGCGGGLGPAVCEVAAPLRRREEEVVAPAPEIQQGQAQRAKGEASDSEESIMSLTQQEVERLISTEVDETCAGGPRLSSSLGASDPKITGHGIDNGTQEIKPAAPASPNGQAAAADLPTAVPGSDVEERKDAHQSTEEADPWIMLSQAGVDTSGLLTERHHEGSAGVVEATGVKATAARTVSTEPGETAVEHRKEPEAAPSPMVVSPEDTQHRAEEEVGEKENEVEKEVVEEQKEAEANAQKEAKSEAQKTKEVEEKNEEAQQQEQELEKVEQKEEEEEEEREDDDDDAEAQEERIAGGKGRDVPLPEATAAPAAEDFLQEGQDVAGARVGGLLEELERLVGVQDDATLISNVLNLLEEDFGMNGVARLLSVERSDGNGLLHLSVLSFAENTDWQNAAAIVELLVDWRCDPCKPNQQGESPLLLAVRAAAFHAPKSASVAQSVSIGVSTIVQALITAGADPNGADELGETALMEAACIPSMELCQVLIDARADVEQTSQSNLTAMDFADDPKISELFEDALQGRRQRHAAAVPVTQQAGKKVPSNNAAPSPSTREGPVARPQIPPVEASPAETTHRPPVARAAALAAEPPVAAAAAGAAASSAAAAATAAAAAAATTAPATEATTRPAAEAAAAPVENAERATVSMSDLLARARRSLPAPIAAAAEDALLGRLYTRLTEPLVDAVQAHAASQVAEKLAVIQKLNRKSSTTMSEVLGYRDADGHTLLHLCILTPLIEGTLTEVANVLQQLISSGAAVNAANTNSETPLLLAVREMFGGSGDGRLILVRTLLDGKADPNLADRARVTPLLEAAQARDRKLLELLLARGGNAFLRGGKSNRTPFEELCSNAPTLAAYLAEQPFIQGVSAEGPRAATGAASSAPPAQDVPTKERLTTAMCNEVQGHNASGVREVLRQWEEESWRITTLMDWYDQDGNSWLHLSLLAPPMEEHWRAVRDVVCELLANLADADRANNDGETPLLLLTREASGTGEGRLDLLQDLLAFGATCDRFTHRGRTPLMEAAELGDVLMCEALLQAGADPDLSRPGTTSPARTAARNPELAILFRPCSQDGKLHPNIDGKAGAGAPSAATPTMAAASEPGQDPLLVFKHNVMLHSSQRVSALLSAADASAATLVSQVDKDGNTPLHLCLLAPPADPELASVVRTLEALLCAKADPNAANTAGETPLLMAVRETVQARQGQGAASRLRIVDLLIHAKADVEATDGQGLSAMAEACSQDDPAVVELLVVAGGDVEVEVAKGKKAIQLAPAGGAVRRQFWSATESGAAGGEGGAKGQQDRGKGAASISRAPALVQAVHAHDAKLLQDLLAAYKAEGKNLRPLLSAADADGHGLLHICIIAPQVHQGSSAFLETVKVLLHAKAETNVANSLGETPLLLVVREMAGTDDSSRVSMVRALMKAGAEADMGDNQDTTPLMEAAMLGDAELCRILLDRGADMHRCGAGGLSARELASKFASVQEVFNEQGEKVPAEGDEDEEEAQPVQVTLKHPTTHIKKIITIAGNATICDLKKQVVRVSHRGSWRRIVLLTEQGRALHDTEYLNGRTLLIMADIKSPEGKRATEDALPEEERWKKWSLNDLKAEADRRGVFGGKTKEQLLETLLEVKRWENLSAKDLKIDCSKRALAVDTVTDKEELLAQLKQDFSWDMMEEEELRQECESRGIPPPGEKDPQSGARAMRSRLRQVLRWEMLPEAELKKACDLRYMETQGKSRKELLAFLKSFTTLQRPKAKPKAGSSSSSSSRAQQNGRASGSHAHGSSPGSDSEDELNPCPPGFSDRVKKLCAKYPSFTGTYPPDMEEWTDKEIEVYLYTHGQQRPKPQKKNFSHLSKVPKSVHYKTLGVRDGAENSEVRRAYRRLALIYHPDKNPGDPKASAEQFKAITEAYEALTSDGAK